MITTKVKLKEIYGDFRASNFDQDYKWDELKENIETKGMLSKIFVFKIRKVLNVNYLINSWPDIKYYILDGNHRCRVLEEIHGGDYEFEVNVREDSEFVVNVHNEEWEFGKKRNGMMTPVSYPVSALSVNRTDTDSCYVLDGNIGIYIGKN